MNTLKKKYNYILFGALALSSGALLSSCDKNDSLSPTVEAGDYILDNLETVVVRDESKVSDDTILIKTENLINRIESAKNSNMIVRAIRVERSIPGVQISGLIPIVVEFKLNNMPVQSIVYTNKDATAYITGLVYRYDTSVYGDSFFQKSVAQANGNKKLLKDRKSIKNDDFKFSEANRKIESKAVAIIAGNLQAEASVGIESLQKGKNEADKVTPSEEMKTVSIKRKSLNPNKKIFKFNGNNITSKSLWNTVLDKQVLFIEEGNKKAPLFYVIHDPWCPVCHRFFEESRDLVSSGKVRIRWITVYGLNHHSNFAGKSSFDVAYKILNDKNPAKAFVEYESHNVLPNKSEESVNKDLLVRMSFNIKLTNYVLNGTQITPSVIWKGESGLLGLKAGLSAAGMGELAKSGKVSSN